MSTICFYPFTNITVNPNGAAAPCCKYNLNHADELINNETLYTRNIEELFYQPAMEKIREQFRNNVKPKACQVCWDEESTGVKSLREIKNDWINIWKSHKPIISDIINNPTIISMDMKFSNLCNLRCRICGPYCSSNWLNESLETGEFSEHTIKIFSKYSEKKFVENANNFEILRKLLPETLTMEFYGGEPLMQPEHREIMKILDDAEPFSKKDLQLRYNTNGTIYDQYSIDVWNKIRFVNLNISVDDVGKRFEYQRHPAKWDAVVSNIHLYKNNCRKMKTVNGFDESGIELKLYCTVSLFNVFYLDELIRFNEDNFQLPLEFNLVHWPSDMSIANLPRNIKKLISEKLMKLADSLYVQRLHDIINFMNSTAADENLLKNFLIKVNIHDKYREQSFADTFSEFNSLLMTEMGHLDG